MKKTFILTTLAFVFALVLAVNFVSASHSGGCYWSWDCYNDRSYTYNYDYSKTETEKISISKSYDSHTPVFKHYVPYSSWKFKEPYNHYNPRHRDSRYNYYYEPRYDHFLGHYNWRY